MSESREPVPRGDNIGFLVRRLIGDDQTPPDLTAAVPLYDAFLEAGNVFMAGELLRCVESVRQRMEGSGFVRRQRDRQCEQIRGMLFGILGPYLFDLASTCSYIDSLVRGSEEQPLQEGRVEVATVRVPVGRSDYVPELGEHYQLPDGRTGIVVGRAPNGEVEVLPLAQQDSGRGMIGQPEYYPPASSFSMRRG